MAKRVMKVYDVYWSPTGQKIATVTASTAKAAKRKAPKPYRKYLGEIYVEDRGEVKSNPRRKRVAKTNRRSVARGATIPAKLVRKPNGKYAVMVTREAARKLNPGNWTIAKIRAANKAAGQHFFSKDSMKFFHSRIEGGVSQGLGGVFFITSEYMDHPSMKTYKVRQFNPETAHIRTAGEYRDKVSAQIAARMAARG